VYILASRRDKNTIPTAVLLFSVHEHDGTIADDVPCWSEIVEGGGHLRQISMTKYLTQPLELCNFHIHN